MNKTSTLKKVLKRIQNYRILVGASLLMAAVTVLLTLYLPILTGEAVDGILGQGMVNYTGLFRILKRMVVIIAATALFQWLMSIINNHITYHVVQDLRKEAFEKLERLPLKYVDRRSHGDIVSRMITDVDQFAEGLLMGFTQLFSGLLTIAATLFFMFAINIRIALVVVLLTPLSLFVAAFIARRTYHMFQKQSETRGEQTALIEEMIGNLKVVKAFGREEENQERFDEINGRLQKYSLNAIFFSSLVNPSTRFINSMIYAGVGITGAVSALSGGITVGQLTCFLSYANQYTKPFNEISGVITELQNALACAARVFELIEEEPEMPDQETAVVLENTKGDIRLENVYFSYRADKKLIQNFNLSVKTGQRIAIVGPTGCGKTTLINLLMRFYDVDKGQILIDHKEIRNITRGSLRKNFGMVLQDTWIRNGTVKENITIGKPEASMEQVIAAAKESHAHDFIKRLPQGYDTVLMEDGGNLSQGQKQLLCITRVMLCLPPMLILDEATSSIDTRTEMKIQQAFARMMEGRTSFVVAHRLYTIKEADMILVMKDGNIIEQGDHETLLADGGFYADLYNSQFEAH